MSSTLDRAPLGADAEGRNRSFRRPARRDVAIALIGLVAVVAVTVTLVVRLTGGPGAAPYDDPAATGRLTLCTGGSAVTEGSTRQPLADVVAGATAAAAAYAGNGRAATLFAYQPRAGVASTEWTGLQLTAPVTYDDPARPRLALRAGDTTLSQFLAGYPAVDDGWVQLRLYLGAVDQPVQSLRYDAVDLHVDGDTWHAVDPGAASCAR